MTRSIRTLLLAGTTAGALVAGPSAVASATADRHTPADRDPGRRTDRRPRQMADITGDGLMDTVGCGDRGTAVTEWMSFSR